MVIVYLRTEKENNIFARKVLYNNGNYTFPDRKYSL